MKKLILVIISILFSFGMNAIVQVNLGIDFAGEFSQKWKTIHWDYDSVWYTKTGVSPSLEFLSESKNILFGFGAEYQIERVIEFKKYWGTSGKDIRFTFIPLYFTAKVPIFKKIDENGLSVIGSFGFNFYKDNQYLMIPNELNGGLYSGFGFEYVKNNFILQTTYKINNFTFDDINDLALTNYTCKNTYSHFTTTIGYRFLGK